MAYPRRDAPRFLRRVGRLVSLIGLAVAVGLLLPAVPAQAAGETSKQICKRFMRQFDQQLPNVERTYNVYRARVLRARASFLCHHGRPGEGQLLMEAALMAVGITPKPNNLIQKAIKEREEREKRQAERRWLFE